MEFKIKILLVEDTPSDVGLIQREITKSGIQFNIKVVETRGLYIESLKEFKPDLILSDYNLPSFNGMQALLLRKEHAPLVPFILVTGANNEEIAVECMKSGADDYILKNNLLRLGQAIRAAIEKKSVIKANIQAMEKLGILSRAVEQNPALIVITDKNGIIEYVNPQYTETTGYKLEEVIGKTPRILKSGHQSPEFYKDLWKTIISGKEWRGEMLNKKKNGDLYWEDGSISPLLNESGQITHLIGIKEDVTEKRKMIVDLIQAKEKAEAGDNLKSAFINNISHEIRTPLSTIEGFVEMLLSTETSAENKISYSQIIKKSSSRLLRTISNYMDISLIVSGNMEVRKTAFSLNKMLAGLKDEFLDACTEQQIKLTILKPDVSGDIMLNTDPDHLLKVWSHLIGNAVKFTLRGEISFGYRQTPKGLSFFVTDTGIGIDSDKVQLIFDYFMQADVSQTRTYEGSGLGLSIARDLVKLLGGRIFVESAKDKGSTFSFTLAEDSTVTVIEKQEPTTEQPQSKAHPLILVAEDDDFNYKYLDIILKRSGYLVERAANGLEAVNACRSNPDVSLILMDMKMPVMGGLDATREIRSFLPGLHIIALTAYVSLADENAAYEAGCNEFLSKPVNREKLLGLLKKVLGT